MIRVKAFDWFTGIQTINYEAFDNNVVCISNNNQQMHTQSTREVFKFTIHAIIHQNMFEQFFS